MEYNKFAINIGKFWFYTPIILSSLMILYGVIQILLCLGHVVCKDICVPIYTFVHNLIPYLPACLSPVEKGLGFGQGIITLLYLFIGGIWTNNNIIEMCDIEDPDDLRNFCVSSIWKIILGCVAFYILINPTVYSIAVILGTFIGLIGLILCIGIVLSMCKQPPEDQVIFYKENGKWQIRQND